MADVLSLPTDFRGEQALEFLPEPGPRSGELMIYANSVERIDAYGGCALRACVEYVARYHQLQVTLSPPDDAQAWRLMHRLIEPDCPGHLVLPNDAAQASGSTPRSVLLPAVPIPNVSEADQIAEVLVDRASGRLGGGTRLLAGVLSELVVNALAHAPTRISLPVPPIACIVHERHEDELQLVVCDLGRRLVGGSARDDLLAVLEASPEGYLTELGAYLSHRRIDARVELAAGSGRCAWTGARWHATDGNALNGFAASVVIPL